MTQGTELKHGVPIRKFRGLGDAGWYEIKDKKSLKPTLKSAFEQSAYNTVQDVILYDALAGAVKDRRYGQSRLVCWHLFAAVSFGASVLFHINPAILFL